MSEKMCVIHSEKCVNIVRAECRIEDRRTGEVSLSQVSFEICREKLSETDFVKVSVCGSEIDNLERVTWYKYTISQIVNKYGFNLLEVVRLDFERNFFDYVFYTL